jgi:preprotein translocase SecE subunit
MVSLWFNSWFGLNRESYIVVLVGLLAGFGWLGLRFLRGPRFQRWSVGMEEGGWFSASSYKKTQGLKVRRFTILGILVLLGSGILTLIQTGRLAAGETWTLSFPHDVGTLTLLPDMGLTLPLILGALALWVAYRAVNYPPFADFLIATEAEMNKVSWTPRKRLLQDTVVVLVTVGLLTLFLFVVDMFWGWFLSRPFIGVLPSPQYQYVVSIEKIEDPAKRADAAKVIAEVTGMSPEAARLVVEAVPQGNEPQPKTKKKSTRPIPALPEETAETLAKRLREEAGAQVAVDRARGAQAADAQEW